MLGQKNTAVVGPLDITYEVKRMTETTPDYEVLDLMRVEVRCDKTLTIPGMVILCELCQGHEGRHYGHLWADQEATVMWGKPANVIDEDIPF